MRRPCSRALTRCRLSASRSRRVGPLLSPRSSPPESADQDALPPRAQPPSSSPSPPRRPSRPCARQSSRPSPRPPPPPSTTTPSCRSSRLTRTTSPCGASTLRSATQTGTRRTSGSSCATRRVGSTSWGCESCSSLSSLCAARELTGVNAAHRHEGDEVGVSFKDADGAPLALSPALSSFPRSPLAAAPGSFPPPTIVRPVDDDELE